MFQMLHINRDLSNVDALEAQLRDLLSDAPQEPDHRAALAHFPRARAAAAQFMELYEKAAPGVKQAVKLRTPLPQEVQNALWNVRLDVKTVSDTARAEFYGSRRSEEGYAYSHALKHGCHNLFTALQAMADRCPSRQKSALGR